MRAAIAIVALVGGLIGGARPLAAQQRSPIAELLARARSALDNLQYSRADSIARGVLALGTRVSRAEQIEALQLAAASLFPEERQAQKRDSATGFLRQFVRLAPDRDLPRAISWPGLDSLLVGVRATTFAAIARPQRENVLTGANTQASLPVTATRVARFTLLAVPASGAPIVLDTVGPARDEVLHLRLQDRDQARLTSGNYLLRVTAVDAATAGARDTITITYSATVDAPSLTLLPVPGALEPNALLPEQSKPDRGKNIAIGVALGGATALFANLFRAPEPVKSGASSDSRAYVIGGALAIGALLGGMQDKGSPLPQNILRNAQTRAAFQKRVQDAEAENAKRRAAYRGSITINPEPR